MQNQEPPLLFELSDFSAFYGVAQILFDINICLETGTSLGVLGRNGVGKSTLLRALMKQGPTSRGEAFFKGTLITGLKPYQIPRHGIGYVPQDKRLFTSLSVLENLDTGRKAAANGQIFWDVERIFGLFPNLEKLKNKPAGALSGGEQQMLAIARTFLGNPEIILLDEISEGLSPMIVTHLAKVLHEYQQDGHSLIMAEQNFHLVQQLCDRFIFLQNGHIIAESDKTSLAKDNSFIRRTLGIGL